MPQQVFLFLDTCSGQQLGFKLSLPHSPVPVRGRGSRTLQQDSGGDTGQKGGGRGPRQGGAWEAGQATSAPDRPFQGGRCTARTTSSRGLRRLGTRLLSAGPSRRGVGGCAKGRKGNNSRFLEKKGGGM